MGRKQKIKAGDWVGMWEVVNISDIEQGTNRKVLCKCGECGKPRLVFVNNLLSGKSTKCPDCRDRRPTNSNRRNHPRIRMTQVGTVLGALTVTKVLTDTAKQRGRRTVEAKCLCGGILTQRVDVIRRDEFPTCHHCQENGTLYRWPLRDHMKILDSKTMDDYANSRGCQWFDMMVDPPVKHVSAGFLPRVIKTETEI